MTMFLCFNNYIKFFIQNKLFVICKTVLKQAVIYRKSSMKPPLSNKPPPSNKFPLFKGRKYPSSMKPPPPLL